MFDDKTIISKIKKLNLFTSINYLYLDNKDFSDEDLLSLNKKHDIELDVTDRIIIYKIDGDSLVLKEKTGISYKSENALDDETLFFDFEKGTYIFLQVNENYDTVEYFFNIIQKYINKNNLKVNSKYLIQRLLKEDNKTISQFCLKI